MEDQPDEIYQRAIPVPDIAHVLIDPDGTSHNINLENTTIVVHPEQFEQFDHLYIDEEPPLTMFNIKATPFLQYLLEQQYSVRIDKFPRLQTELAFFALQQLILEQELEHGLGHELDEEFDDEG